MRLTSASLLTLCCAAPTIAVILATPASAATTPFGSGNIVVEQVGDGSATLTSAATATFLDEFTDPNSGSATQAQQISLPTTDSGSATSDGQLTNSVNGAYVVVPGFNTPVGTASVASSTPSGTVNARTALVVTADGGVDASTSNNGNSGTNLRSATLTGSTILTSGGSSVQTQSFGTTTSTAAFSANLRVVHSYAGQTFLSSGSGTSKGIGYVSGSTETLLPGVTTPGSPYGFALLRTGTGPTFAANGVDTGADTLYFTDDTSATAGGLFKYTWNGSTWSAAGSLKSTLRGLAARVVGPNVEIFTTIDGAIYKTIDTSGFGGTLAGSLTSIAAASPNTAFRGVAFAPTATALPTPTSSLPETPYAVLLPLIGLTAIGVVAMRRSAKRAS